MDSVTIAQYLPHLIALLGGSADATGTTSNPFLTVEHSPAATDTGFFLMF